MTIQDSLDVLLRTAEKVLDMGEGAMSRTVDDSSIPKVLAEYFGVSENDVRATKIKAQNNVVNRINYEALWKNPVVLCVAIVGDPGGVVTLLDSVKDKIAKFALYVPVALGVVPRIRVALIITRVEQQSATLAYVATFSDPGSDGTQSTIEPTGVGRFVDPPEGEESGEDDA